MTLKEAVRHFFRSALYKEKAKLKTSEGSSLRNNKYRNEENRLGEKSAKAMLLKYGYTQTEDFQPPKKATAKKKTK